MNIPRSLRTLLRLSLAVAVLHIMFGAVVRISGSGMGCGDPWPQCNGAWFPPMDQPTLVLEWTHRLGGQLLDPLKTTVVQHQRCMTTWVVQKPPA